MKAGPKVNFIQVTFVKLILYHIVMGKNATIKETTANRILELCAKRDITVNMLSTMSGVNQSTLNNIINSGSNNPTLATIKKICDGFGITLGEFFSTQEFDHLEQELK